MPEQLELQLNKTRDATPEEVKEGKKQIELGEKNNYSQMRLYSRNGYNYGNNKYGVKWLIQDKKEIEANNK